MKQRNWFILLIFFGLITSCATVHEQPTPADTGNDGLALPPVPQKPTQPVEAVTSSAVDKPSTTWVAPDDKPYVQDYSPQCPSLAVLSGVHPDNPPITAESVELTPRSAAQREQLQLAAISDQQAVQYLQQRRFLKALPLAKTAYRFQNDALGEQHPDSLASLINFALIYQQLGHFSEALPLLEKGYRLSKEVLGEKHPSTFTSLNNLALIYQDLGSADEALPLLEKVYRLRKEVLGEKHPDTIGSLNNFVSDGVANPAQHKFRAKP
jgi:tetratricopeptide (TPR) repeat protein